MSDLLELIGEENIISVVQAGFSILGDLSPVKDRDDLYYTYTNEVIRFYKRSEVEKLLEDGYQFPFAVAAEKFNIITICTFVEDGNITFVQFGHDSFRWKFNQLAALKKLEEFAPVEIEH